MSVDHLDLYAVLGVARDANVKTINEAFRKLSKKHHPDVGGDEEMFKQLSEAYDILRDPERRDRYDKTGKTKPGPSEERIRDFIYATVDQVIEAKTRDGTVHDPEWVNIKRKVLDSIKSAKDMVTMNCLEHRDQQTRIESLLRRFKPKGEHDPVGDALRVRLEAIKGKIEKAYDTVELYDKARDVFLGYDYEMGPDPEGQHRSRPTSLRISTGGVSIEMRGR